MIRHRMGTLPAQTPVEEDLHWAVELFEDRMRFVRYNSEYAVQLHTTDSDTTDKLVKLFGGGSYLVPGTKTYRWRATKDIMLQFLDKVQPLLSPLGGQRLLALANLLEAQERANGEKSTKKQIAFFVREHARQVAIEEDAKK